MSYMLQPRVVLLKEGVDDSQGTGQLLSNINAVEAVVSIVKTTLGPRGMDKLIHDSKGNVTISNDGATLVALLDIVHPAAKTLVDIARSQDAEIGDGTTSVCILAGEFLKQCKAFVEDGLHPQIIIKGYRLAREIAVKRLLEIAVNLHGSEETKEGRQLLLNCAQTALNSKLISSHKEFFAEIVVSALEHAGNDNRMIGIEKVSGGDVLESQFVRGLAFKKTFSYAGFEQQPKNFDAPKIVLLNVELELKSELATLEVRINDTKEYQAVVDAEWKIIYDKLEKVVNSGAQVILSRLPIGDLATQYFADRNLFCAGRVHPADMKRVASATGAKVQTSVNDLSDDILGTCEKFEEKGVGTERFNFFVGCPFVTACTVILRGGAEQYIAETERSLHDAIMIVKRTVENRSVVGGGGAVEMELSRHLKAHSKTVTSKIQLVLAAYARALEVIPHQLCENAGLDSTEIVNRLRHKHATDKDGLWFGVDIENEGIWDTMKGFVWEPTMIRQNALNAATEAAIMILSIDETVKNPKAQESAHSKKAVRGDPRAQGRR
jgi:T-complex protein 1 subunit eta